MGKKILVIDDSNQDRKIIKRYLNQAGYDEVVLARTGQEGVDMAGSEKPDVVVLDTLLPDFDGFEVCRRIRKEHNTPSLKIIMMTGAIDAVDAVKARKVGADDYTAKTEDCGPLVDAVNMVS